MSRDVQTVAIPDGDLARRNRRRAMGGVLGCALGLLMFAALVAYFALGVTTTEGSSWLYIGIGAAFLPFFALGLVRSLRYLRRSG